MSASKLDAVYRSILITKFFTKGWGKPDNLRRLFEFRKVVSNREECYKLIPADYPVTITKEEKGTDCHILEGHFLTPMETFLPGVVPPCAHRAHFQVIMPAKWADSDAKPMCVHLAGTGDHYFWRRRNLMAKPLMKEAGIGAVILENPFYGLRKPQDQVRSSLHNVSDIFVMGGCLILETLVLLHWCERNGLGPLGVTGLSMGGHMASLAATNWPKPLVLVPCLSWSTASAVFTQGVMSHSINWELLESQFFSDGQYRDKLAKMVTIVDEAFLAGRKFAQRFSRHESKIQPDVNAFTLPNIVNTTDPSIKTFDITNPNNLSSCQGLFPEVSQRYSVTGNTDNNATGVVNNKVTSLECLKTDNKISDDLYNKITSEERFYLEPSEIDELNRIAFKNVDKVLSAKIPQKDSNSVANTENVQCVQNDAVESSVLNDNSCESSKNVITSDTGLDKDGKYVDSVKTDVKIECVKSDDVKNNENIKNDTNNNAQAVSMESKIITNIMIDSDGEGVSDGDKKKKSVGAAKNILSSIPFLGKGKEETKVNVRNREALQFMRGVMDECTHLGNFTVPFDTSLIIAVCAKNDAYVPRGDSGALEELWPGAEVRYIDAGHVSAYVLHQSMFRSCIAEAFRKSKETWAEGKHTQ